MGEYTSVLLTVQKADIDTVTSLSSQAMLERGPVEADGELCDFQFLEVRDGELDFLDELKQKSIPYSVYIDPVFNDHDGLEQHYRPDPDFECEFAAGETVVPIGELKQAIAKGLDEVKALVDSIERRYHVPDWPCGRKTLVLGHDGGVGAACCLVPLFKPGKAPGFHMS